MTVVMITMPVIMPAAGAVVIVVVMGVIVIAGWVDQHLHDPALELDGILARRVGVVDGERHQQCPLGLVTPALLLVAHGRSVH
jgi:hypothetical protein